MSFAFSYVERALQESLGARKFSRSEIDQILAFFDMEKAECIYCGSQDVGRWDHLVPVALGGETVIGNMVPACGRCDDSKQHLPYDQWMRSSARFAPNAIGVPDVEARIQRIKKYVRHFGYGVRNLDERLSPNERMQLETLRGRIRELRSDLDAFVRGYRERIQST